MEDKEIELIAELNGKRMKKEEEPASSGAKNQDDHTT
jgi:hypothetical protein